MNKPAETIIKNPEDLIEIGDNIKRLRKKRKLSQEKLAEKLCAKFTVISRYERGTSEMGVLTLIRLMEALEASPDQILPERILRNGVISAKAYHLKCLIDSLQGDDLDALITIAERLRK